MNCELIMRTVIVPPESFKSDERRGGGKIRLGRWRQRVALVGITVKEPQAVEARVVEIIEDI